MTVNCAAVGMWMHFVLMNLSGKIQGIFLHGTKTVQLFWHTGCSGTF